MTDAARWFVLQVNPEPWAVGPVGVSRHGGKLRPYVGRNQQLHAFQEAVREELGEQAMIEGPVDLAFFFWRQRVSYRTPRQAEQQKHDADLTNLVKACEDALQGVLFRNDRDVHHTEGWIAAQGPDIQPRIVIRATSCTGLDPDVIPPDIWEIIDLQDLLSMVEPVKSPQEGEVPF